jgi:hypothetical protein
MIDFENPPMSTRNITMIGNVERKVIKNIDFLSIVVSKDVNKEAYVSI